MLRQKFSFSPYQSTPRSHLKTEKPVLSEWRLAIVGLVVSLVVIAGKVYFANQDDIRKFFVEPRLGLIEVINEEGQIMYHYYWKNVVKYSEFWLPVLCGALTTYFTWMMVYLDSHVPGIQPPSPFSPTKYKTKSGHSFHLNYVFAVVMGILVAAYMFWRDVKIEYS